MTNKKYRRQIIMRYRQRGIPWSQIKMILNGTAETAADKNSPNHNPHNEYE
jgi:hypothetical protein